MVGNFLRGRFVTESSITRFDRVAV
eukprot:SAG31_NODE_44139_length_264_cov_0.624242_1_plen_24_part_01